nr:immunoglobulin light chain junction region [Macaca mulatta]
CQQYKRLPYTF